MSRYMEDVIEGKETSGRPLRKKDDLRDFYELLKLTVKVLKGKKWKSILQEGKLDEERDKIFF